MSKCVTSLSPLSGSFPVKLFPKIEKVVTASIARMPPSGSAPAKRLVEMAKLLTSLSPLSGSTPVKLFLAILKLVMASIARMPPGSTP
eukprot:6282444-Amphidinium_carterae.1